MNTSELEKEKKRKNIEDYDYGSERLGYEDEEEYEKKRFSRRRSESGYPEESNVMSIGDWLKTVVLLAVPILNIVMFFKWIIDKEDPRRNYCIATLIFSILIILFFYVLGFILKTIYTYNLMLS